MLQAAPGVGVGAGAPTHAAGAKDPRNAKQFAELAQVRVTHKQLAVEGDFYTRYEKPIGGAHNIDPKTGEGLLTVCIVIVVLLVVVCATARIKKIETETIMIYESFQLFRHSPFSGKRRVEVCHNHEREAVVGQTGKPVNVDIGRKDKYGNPVIIKKMLHEEYLTTDIDAFKEAMDASM